MARRWHVSAILMTRLGKTEGRMLCILLLLGAPSCARAIQNASLASGDDIKCLSCRAPSISANQVHKNPRPVEYRKSFASAPAMSESEWADRVELAALARVMYVYGFGSDLAAQCVVARLRDQPDTMLMNECTARGVSNMPARAVWLYCKAWPTRWP